MAEGDPITLDNWPTFFDSEGRVLYEYQVRKSCFFKVGGPGTRTIDWQRAHLLLICAARAACCSR